MDAKPPYGLLIMPDKVFISYRREDSRYQARRVYDAFVHALPPDTVFMDVDSIPPGADFVEILEGWVKQCDVLLALIGPNWLSSIDPRTNLRRLDSPEDFVRIEVRGALRRKIPVVPVLLDATEMPTAAELPDDIKALRRRHAEFVDFRTFDTDVQRLIKRLKIGKKSELPAVAAGPQAEDGGRRTVHSFLQAIRPNVLTAKPPLLLAAAALLLLAVGSAAYVMSAGTHVDASAGLADFAKSEEGRRAAEARASQATDALAIAEKARQEAEARATDAAAAQAKSEAGRRAAETRTGEAADALAKAEKARQEAEAAATAAAAAQAKSEEGRRAAETRAGEASDALAKTEKARQEAEAKATAAATALARTEENRRTAEARANDAADTLKKSDKARLDAEARLTSAAAAQAKAEEGLRAAEKARSTAEAAAMAATIARIQIDTAREGAETRANDTADALKKSEKARQEAEARLAALEKARELQDRAGTRANPDPLPAGIRPTIGPKPSSSRKLLAEIGSKSRWVRSSKIYCYDTKSPNYLSLEVGNDSISWVNGAGKVETEKIVASYENAFHTDSSQQRLAYSRQSDGSIHVEPTSGLAFFLEKCP